MFNSAIPEFSVSIILHPLNDPQKAVEKLKEYRDRFIGESENGWSVVTELDCNGFKLDIDLTKDNYVLLTLTMKEDNPLYSQLTMGWTFIKASGSSILKESNVLEIMFMSAKAMPDFVKPNVIPLFEFLTGLKVSYRLDLFKGW